MVGTKQLHLMPAYGRRYNSRAKLLTDWYSGKDFLSADGGYTSYNEVEILKRLGYTHLQFRYSQQQRVFVMPIDQKRS